MATKPPIWNESAEVRMELTHLDETGAARMVDVGAKAVSYTHLTLPTSDLV